MSAARGPVGVGVIGAGLISNPYIENLMAFPDVEVHVVGDLYPEVARERAEQYGVPAWGTAEDVLAHPDVEIVVNLTIPAVHAEISLAAVESGRHVWTEKPLATDRDAGRSLVETAAARGLLVGCAPDTLLGPGMQSALRLIDSGAVGRVLSAQTLLQTPGPQRGHPNPDFFFRKGAGPLFDYGPYYISALVTVFGPVRRVAAMGSRSTDTRVIGSGPRQGEVIPVDVATHVGALYEFDSGAVAQSVFSFDAQLNRQGFFEVSGTEATLAIPDPNRFTGPSRIAYAPTSTRWEPNFQIEWHEFPDEGVVTNRGLGVLDMARAIRGQGSHIATGALGLHVLDVMVSIEESVEGGGFVDVATTVDPVGRMPQDFDPFAATL